MKILDKSLLALSGLGAAFGLVASLSTPVDTAGFSLIGGSLGLGQRDFRVFNNFTDASANNNTTPDPDFPSAVGATQAIWKGHIEWGSEWYLLVGDQEFDSPKTLAAFALGLVLFIVTLVLNFVAIKIVQKYREQYD